MAIVLAPRRALDTTGVLGRTGSLSRAALVVMSLQELAYQLLAPPVQFPFEFALAHLPGFVGGEEGFGIREDSIGRCARGRAREIDARDAGSRLWHVESTSLESCRHSHHRSVPLPMEPYQNAARMSRRERARGGQTDGIRYRFGGSAGRRKDAGTRWLGCCPPEMSTGETHPRAKRPMNRAKTPLRRRAAPNRFAVEIKGAGLFPMLKVRTRLSDPVFDGDQLLAAALAEFADQHTSLLGDLQHVGLKLRLLDAFGAFPASRLIAFAYMMASRKSGQKLRVVRPATTGAYTPCAGASSSWRDDPQRSEFKFLSEAWYRRSTELGDPVAASMAERKYHVLGEPFQQDLCGKRRNLYELPTTLSARALAPRFLSRDRALAQAVRVVFAAAE